MRFLRGSKGDYFNSLLCVFDWVLNRPLEEVDALRAKENRCLLIVLSVAEVERLMQEFFGSRSFNCSPLDGL